MPNEDNLKKYYEYLVKEGADTPMGFDSFRKTLSDSATANQYYDYLKKEGFDAPESFESFSTTFGFDFSSNGSEQAGDKKKEPTTQARPQTGEVPIGSEGGGEQSLEKTSLSFDGLSKEFKKVEVTPKTEIRNEDIDKYAGIDNTVEYTPEITAKAFDAMMNAPKTEQGDKLYQSAVRQYADYWDIEYNVAEQHLRSNSFGDAPKGTIIKEDGGTTPYEQSHLVTGKQEAKYLSSAPPKVLIDKYDEAYSIQKGDVADNETDRAVREKAKTYLNSKSGLLGEAFKKLLQGKANQYDLNRIESQASETISAALENGGFENIQEFDESIKKEAGAEYTEQVQGQFSNDLKEYAQYANQLNKMGVQNPEYNLAFSSDTWKNLDDGIVNTFYKKRNANKEAYLKILDAQYPIIPNRSIKESGSDVKIKRENQAEYNAKLAEFESKESKYNRVVANLIAREYMRRNPTKSEYEVGLVALKALDLGSYNLYTRIPEDEREDVSTHGLVYQLGADAFALNGRGKEAIEVLNDIDNISPTSKSVELINRMAVILDDGSAASKKILKEINPDLSPTGWRYIVSSGNVDVEKLNELVENHPSFTNEDKRHWKKHGEKMYRSNFYATIPTSGFISELGGGMMGAFQSQLNTAGQVFGWRNDADAAKDALSGDKKTFFTSLTNVKEAAIQEREALLKKEDKTIDDLNRLADLEKMSTVTNGFRDFTNTNMNTLGQVVEIAALSAVMTPAVRTIGGIAGMQSAKVLGAEIGASSVSQSLAFGMLSYDSYYMEGLEKFGGDNESFERHAYAILMTAAEMGVEKIIPEKKYTRGFMRQQRPVIQQLIRDLKAGRITRDVFSSRLSKMPKLLGQYLWNVGGETLEEYAMPQISTAVTFVLNPEKGVAMVGENNHAANESGLEMLKTGWFVGVLGTYGDVQKNKLQYKLQNLLLDNKVKAEFIAALDKQKETGQITAEEHQETMNLMKDIVEAKSDNTKDRLKAIAPKLSKNGYDKYTTLLAIEAKLKRDLEKATSDTDKELIQKNIDQSKQLRDKIIDGNHVVAEDGIVYSKEEYEKMQEVKAETEKRASDLINKQSQSKKEPESTDNEVRNPFESNEQENETTKEGEPKQEASEEATTTNENETAQNEILGTMYGEGVAIAKNEDGNYTYTYADGETEIVSEDDHQKLINEGELEINEVQQQQSNELPMPSMEQQFEDVKNGNTATFEYESESEVPEIFKDKISSKGELNGKPFVKVTMAKSLADYHLQEKGKNEVQQKPKEDTQTTENGISDSGDKQQEGKPDNAPQSEGDLQAKEQEQKPQLSQQELLQRAKESQEKLELQREIKNRAKELRGVVNDSEKATPEQKKSAEDNYQESVAERERIQKEFEDNQSAASEAEQRAKKLREKSPTPPKKESEDVQFVPKQNEKLGTPMVEAQDADGNKIGEIRTYTNPNNPNELTATGIEVSPKKRKQGIAKNLYKKLAESTGKTIVSSNNITEGAIGVWESLVKDGDATKRKDGKYELKPKTAKQENVEQKRKETTTDGNKPTEPNKDGKEELDDVGAGITLYHSTASDFSEFGVIGNNDGKTESRYTELGVHLGTEEQAKKRAEIKRLPKEKQRIIRVKINPKKVIRVTDRGRWTLSAYRNQLMELGLIQYKKEINSFEDVLAVLKNNNIDAFVYNNNYEGNGDSYIIFDNKNIEQSIKEKAPKGNKPMEQGGAKKADAVLESGDEISFITHDKKIVKGKRLKDALNKVADERIKNAKQLRNGNDYASHVTEEEKEATYQKSIKWAEDIRSGKNLNNFTVWQNVNAELTGETIAFLPNKKEPTKKQDNEKQGKDTNDAKKQVADGNKNKGNEKRNKRIKRKGIGKGRTPRGQREIRDENYLKALDVEATDPITYVLQYLIGGGLYHSDMLGSIFGKPKKFNDGSGKKSSIPKGEFNSRIGFLDKNSSIKSPDKLAEKLAQEFSEDFRYEPDWDWTTAVEDAIRLGGKGRMVDAVLDGQLDIESAQEAYDEHYEKLRESDGDFAIEANDYLRDMTDEEIQAIADNEKAFEESDTYKKEINEQGDNPLEASASNIDPKVVEAKKALDNAKKELAKKQKELQGEVNKDNALFDNPDNEISLFGDATPKIDVSKVDEILAPLRKKVADAKANFDKVQKDVAAQQSLFSTNKSKPQTTKQKTIAKKLADYISKVLGIPVITDAKVMQDKLNELGYGEVSIDGVVEKLKQKHPELKTLFVTEDESGISVDMIEVDSDARKNGIGTDVMNAIINYADSVNKEVTLVPATQDDGKGTTSRSRLVKFYKRFGFVENKGRNKDFSRKAGSMFRPPVEFMQTPQGEVYGFAHDGKIYIDPAHLDSETLLHENWHIFEPKLKELARKGNTQAKAIIDRRNKITDPTVKKWKKELAKEFGKQGATDGDFSAIGNMKKGFAIAGFSIMSMVNANVTPYNNIKSEQVSRPTDVPTEQDDINQIKAFITEYFDDYSKSEVEDAINRALYLWEKSGKPIIYNTEGRAYYDNDTYEMGNVSSFEDFIAELSHAVQYKNGQKFDTRLYETQKEYDAIEYEREGSVEYDAHEYIEEAVGKFIAKGGGEKLIESVGGDVKSVLQKYNVNFSADGNKVSLNAMSEVYAQREGESDAQWTERLRGEAMARMVGKNAESFLDKFSGLNESGKKRLGERVQKWMDDFANWVKGTFGISDKTTQEISKMPLKDFVDYVTGLSLGENKIEANNSEVDFAMDEAIQQADKIELQYNDKGEHLAPNGKPSNLTEQQAKIVRTKAFTNWFGDWQNDPQNASKVVDSNGEPLVVYRNIEAEKMNNKDALNYFSTSPTYFSSDRKTTFTVFLNIKDPIDLHKHNVGRDADSRFDIHALSFDLATREPKFNWKAALENAPPSDGGASFVNDLKQSDGVIGKDSGIYREDLPDVFVTYKASQIKLADGTNKTFDPSSNDIRFSVGVGGDVESTAKALDKLANDKPDVHSKLEEQAGVMYHGTEADFDKFDKVGSKIPSLGLGYYFTPTLDKAKQYGSKIKKIVLEGAKILNWNKLSDKEREQIKKRLEGRIPKDMRGLGERKEKVFAKDQRKEASDFLKEKQEQTKDYYYERGKARVRKEGEGFVVSWSDEGLGDLTNAELLNLAQQYDNNIGNAMGYDAAKYGNEIAVFNGDKIKNATNEVIAETYHKAKKDGTNPELVKAVEQSIKEKPKNPLEQKKQAMKDAWNKMGNIGIAPDTIQQEKDFWDFIGKALDYVLSSGVATAKDFSKWFEGEFLKLKDGAKPNKQISDLSKKAFDIIGQSITDIQNATTPREKAKARNAAYQKAIEAGLTESQAKAIRQALIDKSKEIAQAEKREVKEIKKRRGRKPMTISDMRRDANMLYDNLTLDEAKAYVDLRTELTESERERLKGILEDVYAENDALYEEQLSDDAVADEYLKSVKQELGDIARGMKPKSVFKKLFSKVAPKGVIDKIADMDLLYKVASLDRIEKVTRRLFNILATKDADGNIVNIDQVEKFYQKINESEEKRKIRFMLEGLMIDHYEKNGNTERAGEIMENFASRATEMGQQLSSIRKVYESVWGRLPNAAIIRNAKKESQKIRDAVTAKRQNMEAELGLEENEVSEHEATVNEKASESVISKAARLVKKLCKHFKK